MASLEVVAFGDSVVWGQGHAHRDKFVNAVHDWLSSGRTDDPRGVESLPEDRIQARSGAIIGEGDYESDGNEPFSADLSRVARHEMPHAAPTIIEQVAAYPETAFPGESVSLPDPEGVDVVVIDGGINDTGSQTAINPWTSWEQLDRDTERHNHDRLLRLLDRVESKFPAATVIVTGYYPVFSWASDLETAGPALLDAFGVARDPGVDVLLAGYILLADGFGDEPEDSVANALYFHRRQLHQLRRAVSEFQADPSQGATRVVFAHPGYGPENALFAGDNWLFEPGDRGDPAVYDERNAACEQVDGDVACHLANVAHPNVAGATAYANAVVDAHERSRVVEADEFVTAMGGAGLRNACERYGLEPGSGLYACASHRRVDCLEVTIETADVTVQVRDPDDGDGVPAIVQAIAGAFSEHVEELRERYRVGTESDVAIELETPAGPIRNELEHWKRDDFEAGSRGVYVIDPHLDEPGDAIDLADVQGVAVTKDQMYSGIVDTALDLVDVIPGVDPHVPGISDYIEQAIREYGYTDWEPARFELAVNGITVHEETIGTVLSGDDRWEASYPA